MEPLASMRAIANDTQNNGIKNLALTQAAIWELQLGLRAGFIAMKDSETVLKSGQNADLIPAAIVRFSSVEPKGVAEQQARAERSFSGSGGAQVSPLAVAYSLIFAKRYADAAPLWKKLYEKANPSDSTVRGIYALALEQPGHAAEAASLLKSMPAPAIVLAPSFSNRFIPSRRHTVLQHQQSNVVRLHGAFREAVERLHQDPVKLRRGEIGVRFDQVAQPSAPEEIALNVLRIRHSVAVNHDSVARLKLNRLHRKFRIVDQTGRNAGRLQVLNLLAARHENGRTVAGIDILHRARPVDDAVKIVAYLPSSVRSQSIRLTRRILSSIGPSAKVRNAPCSKDATSAELTPLPETSTTSAAQRFSSIWITS